MPSSALSPESWDARTRLLLGDESLQRLNRSHVLVAGLGGVGSAVAEMLVRAGVGRLTLIDGDRVQASNRNRQLIAFGSTEGRPKTEVLKERLKDISPDVNIQAMNLFISEENIVDILAGRPDYVVDAIDTLGPKTLLIASACQMGIPVISSLGSGGKTDPSLVQLSDLSESHHCRLGYYLRKKLHKMDIHSGIKVVFSPEPVPRTALHYVNEKHKKTTAGTVSYMPVIFGCYISSAVIAGLTSG